MDSPTKEKVAILGASNNPERFSYKAFKLLQDYGHAVFPIHPSLDKVENVLVHHKLSDLSGDSIDTLTVYVNPKILVTYVDQIIALKPRRVIFNPGTEDPLFEQRIEAAGIKVVEACTLVMLRTNAF